MTQTILAERKHLEELTGQRDGLVARLAELRAQLPEAQVELDEAQRLYDEANAVGAAAREAAIPIRSEDYGYVVSEYPRAGTSPALIEALEAAREAWKLAGEDLIPRKANVNTLRGEIGHCTAWLEYLNGQVSQAEARLALHVNAPPSAGESLLSRIKEKLHQVIAPDVAVDVEPVESSPVAGTAEPMPATPTRSHTERAELEGIRSRLGF